MQVEWTDNRGEAKQATIYIELFEDKVPVTAGNFRKLAESGKYDGCAFHRIIPDFMIQGGDFTRKNGTGGHAAEYHKGYGTKDDPNTWKIPDEFHEGLSNARGTISMANAGANTGGSQFFINLVDNSYLDFNKAPLQYKHSAFGAVLRGMKTADEIAGIRTASGDKPKNPVTIKSVKIMKKEDYDAI
ncbi:MAG: peptidylprolyl isomerase [Thermoplasmata archaeon HGW-Thermoplasmata-1]|nr:MAG: peptidylprolyl isomerase [Thermoplasmata archaeon HGW-Thermoplasmata-1]